MKTVTALTSWTMLAYPSCTLCGVKLVRLAMHFLKCKLQDREQLYTEIKKLRVEVDKILAGEHP